MRCSKSSTKREVYTNKNLTSGNKKISDKPPNLNPKEKLVKKRRNKIKVIRRKEIIEIRMEINAIEKKIEKINELKSGSLKKKKKPAKLINLQPNTSRKKWRAQINKIINFKLQLIPQKYKGS